LGHKVMAARVLDSLPSSQLSSAPLFVPAPTVGATLFANVRWAAAFAAPWVVRRLRRMTPGAGVEPKSTELVPVI
jgi:hypothetical protein